MPNDRELEALKVPPHSIEAEQSVLGGLLLDNGAADRVADILGADDFYSDAHRLLYKTIVGLIADNKPADVVTLAEALQSLTKLDYVGGMAYLGAQLGVNSNAWLKSHLWHMGIGSLVLFVALYALLKFSESRQPSVIAP